MSLIGIGMNLLLAGLLVAAMVVGLRLNKRLKALRDSHQGFESAVRDLNVAAMRAEQGLADLRAATDEATDLLSDRIEKGRALAAKLERLVSAAPEAPRAAPPERLASRALPATMPAQREAGAEARLAALLSAARAKIEADNAQAEARRAASAPARAPVADEPLVGRAPLPGRRLAAIDDDLFEDAPLSLDRYADERLAGARR